MTYASDMDDPIQVVRHLIGDVDCDAPKLADEEIMYELGASGNDPRIAAIRSCHRLMARYSGVVTVADGELRVEASDFFTHYKALAESIGSIGGEIGDTNESVPFAGGISVFDRETRAGDRGRQTPFFDRDMREDRGSRWGP